MSCLDILDSDWSLSGTRRGGREDVSYEMDGVTGKNELHLPLVDRPFAFLRDAFADTPEKDKIHFAHGTTTLAFRFQGGIIVAVDSRASMGQYIGSGTVKKVIEINPYLLGTMAGGAADCSFWERDLGRRCKLYGKFQSLLAPFFFSKVKTRRLPLFLCHSVKLTLPLFGVQN